jgi:tagaturonate reductase
MKTPIIQFGTSRFLQAHADLFISDAMREGQAVGPVTVVQTSGAAERAERLAAFDGRPLPIVIRGLENGRPVERTEYTTCLVRGLSTAADWAEVERVFVEEADTAITNTGDSGYQMPEDETIGDPHPASFPAKLTRLLATRWRHSGAPMTLFPTELVSSNGVVLAGLCSEVAHRSGLPDDFIAWLRDDCVWANSLVDRIVSQGLKPAGAVAEPYALWAIETKAGLTVPFTHQAVRPVDDLKTTERLKLFILNLGHTCLADRWLKDQREADEAVREMLGDPAVRAWLDGIYDAEILPIFAAAGIGEAPDYRRTVIERFLNPFLDHRLADIAMNHAEKKERRIGGLLAFAAEVAPGYNTPTLIAIRDSGVTGSG